jgi:hypothetical protein
MAAMKAQSRSSQSQLVVGLILIAAVLIVGAATSERWLRKRVLRRLQASDIPSQSLGSGNLPRALEKLGLLYPLPPRILPTQRLRREPKRSIPHERSVHPAFYSLRPQNHAQIAKGLLIPRRWLGQKLPIASLLMFTDDIEELNLHSLERGREWERMGHLSYLEDGELLSSSGVGVRWHGGGRRDESWYRGYRIYFRNDYGLNHFVPPIFPARGRARLKQFVIRRAESGRSRRGRWYFHGPLAFDIARQMGVPTPETKMAAFFINGKHQGIYALTEYIHLDYLQAHFGHEDFTLVRTKRNRNAPGPLVKEGDPKAYEAFYRWSVQAADLSMEEVGQEVDLENLSRWFLAVMFCSTRDLWQGTLVRDQTRDDAKWFWIAWDMDVSFADPPQIDSFLILNDSRGLEDPRQILLRHLIAGSPEYRKFLGSIFCEIMNHRVTDGFLEDRHEFYTGLAIQFGIPDRSFLTDFFDRFLDRRKKFFQERVVHHLEMRGPHTVTVKAPAGRRFVVDGFPKESWYTGEYFEGLELEIRLGEDAKRDFEGWLVNGELIAEESLRWVVHEPLAASSLLRRKKPGLDRESRRGRFGQSPQSDRLRRARAEER